MAPWRQNVLACSLLACVGAMPGHSWAGDPDLVALHRMIGDALHVQVTHEEKLTPAADSKPPLKSDAWSFHAGLLTRTVRYARYLNQPPGFTGQYPSLANADMGIGLDGDAFGHWYRGNALRVLIKGSDVTAGTPAAVTEFRAGDVGRLRLVWNLTPPHVLSLCFTVPEDGHAVFASIDLPPQFDADPLTIILTGYPGGFGPCYGLPSHRSVVTARTQAEVPVGTEAKDYPKIALTSDTVWVFYQDRYTDTGALGLVLLNENRGEGEVQLSNYGITTRLNYPTGTRAVRLGFYAFSVTNATAGELFQDTVGADQDLLRSMAFWP